MLSHTEVIIFMNELSTYHCVEEKGLEVVMETGVDHPTIVVEKKNILDIKLVILRETRRGMVGDR